MERQREIDLMCMGRVAVDLYAEQVGVPLEDVQSFNKYLGGCAGNIAVGSARLGLKVAMLSRVGDDAMGVFLRNTLESEGVDTTQLKTDKEHLTGLVLLGIEPPDHFPLIFYRENCADMAMTPEDVNPDFLEQSKALLITGTALSQIGMRQTTLHAIKTAKASNTALVLDLDYRPVLWGLTHLGDGESRYFSSERVTQIYQSVLAQMDLIVGTEEEILIAGGGREVSQALANIRERSQAPIVMKKGSQGCEVHLMDQVIHCDPFPTTVLNVLGAGDAFLSGFLRGWLRGESWERCGQYGNANGSIVVARHGCAPSMGRWEEIEEMITP